MVSARVLTLHKHGEVYHLSYEVGQEAAVLETLTAMANDTNLSFDWFDAAILAHRVGQYLSEEIKGYLPDKEE